MTDQPTDLPSSTVQTATTAHDALEIVRRLDAENTEHIRYNEDDSEYTSGYSAALSAVEEAIEKAIAAAAVASSASSPEEVEAMAAVLAKITQVIDEGDNGLEVDAVDGLTATVSWPLDVEHPQPPGTPAAMRLAITAR